MNKLYVHGGGDEKPYGTKRLVWRRHQNNCLTRIWDVLNENCENSYLGRELNCWNFED
jgi:hypothetical protein